MHFELQRQFYSCIDCISVLLLWNLTKINQSMYQTFSSSFTESDIKEIRNVCWTLRVLEEKRRLETIGHILQSKAHTSK